MKGKFSRPVSRANVRHRPRRRLPRVRLPHPCQSDMGYLGQSATRPQGDTRCGRCSATPHRWAASTWAAITFAISLKRGSLPVGLGVLARGTAASSPRWAKDAEYAVPVPMTLPSGIDCCVVDLLGFPVSTRADRATSFQLGRELLYLAFGGPDADKVRAILANTFAR